MKPNMKMLFALAFGVASIFSMANAQAENDSRIAISSQDLNAEPNMELLVVSSGSMEPTLPRHSYVLSVPVSSPSDYLRRGAVVSFDVTRSYPVGPYAQTAGEKIFTFYMRVVGLPGDKIELKEGELTVNDLRVVEEYKLMVKPSIDSRKSVPAVIVPINSVYVLGDNREQSNDSRFSGPVPISFIRGLVRYVSEVTVESMPESGLIDKWYQVK